MPVTPLLLLLLACRPDAPAIDRDVPLTWEASATMPTLLQVRWSAVTGSDSWIEYGPTTAYTHAARPGPSDLGLATLPTNAADADVHFRLVVDDGAEVWEGPDTVAHTGSPSADTPTVEVTTDDGGRGWGAYLLVPLFDPERSHTDVILLDPAGQTVWWRREPGFVPSVRMSADGAVLYRTDAYGDPQTTGGVFAASWLTDAVTQVVADDYGHHDFLETPDGGIATIDMELRTVDGYLVRGDQLVLHPPGGEPRVLWSTFDSFSPVPTPSWDSGDDPLGHDWTHSNGVAYDSETDTWLVSVYELRTVVAVDGRTGQELWKLGGDLSDFNLGAGAAFAPQHAPGFAPGGITLFDNHGALNETAPTSRAVRYALDGDTATVAWEWAPQPGVMNPVLGDVRLLASGDTLVSDGLLGELQIVSEDGALVWGGRVQTGIAVGRGVVLGEDLQPL